MLIVLKTGLPSTIVLSIRRSGNILKPPASAFLSLVSTACGGFRRSGTTVELVNNEDTVVFFTGINAQRKG
jgi:hypothetical protein